MIYSPRPSIFRSEPREPGVATSIAGSVYTPELNSGRYYVNAVANAVFISLQASLRGGFRISSFLPCSGTFSVSLSFRSPFQIPSLVNSLKVQGFQALLAVVLALAHNT